MAVAAAAAAAGGGMTEPPTQQMDASRSELVSEEPSSSAGPLSALDRNGSSNSSPDPPKDAEIEVLCCLMHLNCFLSLVSC